MSDEKMTAEQAWDEVERLQLKVSDARKEVARLEAEFNAAVNVAYAIGRRPIKVPS